MNSCTPTTSQIKPDLLSLLLRQAPLSLLLYLWLSPRLCLLLVHWPILQPLFFASIIAISFTSIALPSWFMTIFVCQTSHAKPLFTVTSFLNIFFLSISLPFLSQLKSAYASSVTLTLFYFIYSYLFLQDNTSISSTHSPILEKIQCPHFNVFCVSKDISYHN